MEHQYPWIIKSVLEDTNRLRCLPGITGDEARKEYLDHIVDILEGRYGVGAIPVAEIERAVKALFRFVNS